MRVVYVLWPSFCIRHLSFLVYSIPLDSKVLFCGEEREGERDATNKKSLVLNVAYCFIELFSPTDDEKVYLIGNARRKGER